MKINRIMLHIYDVFLPYFVLAFTIRATLYMLEGI
jgi:hypothetical protein